MKRPLLLVVSDHPLVFESIRAGFEPDFEVLTMCPHAESVIVAAGVLEPSTVIVDLSRRSVQSAAMTARLMEEIPDLPLVLLLDRETNPDVKRRSWLERGLEQDSLGAELAFGLRRAFGGSVRAVHVDAKASDDALLEAIPGNAYSPTFNC